MFVLCGCLQRAVKDFTPTFDVYRTPDKLSFHGFSGDPYSFDVSGYIPGAEVFIESKGYKDGSALLAAYRAFLAKAYCTSVQSIRHRRDHFWFVTNVPFASSIGRRLTDFQFVSASLREDRSTEVAGVLGNAPIDDGHLHTLVPRLAVGIFTDSFIKVMGTSYKFLAGDTLWDATKLLHGGHIPLPRFDTVVQQVVTMNNLKDPNKLRSGQRLHMPWFGIRE